MTKKRLFYLLWIIFIGALLFSYAKSYDNEFHFDDSHTIIDNPYVRDIGNIPLYFTKGSETFSSLPFNQMYRPIVTTTIAIDYWLSTKLSEDGSGYDPHSYHYSMMITYFFMLILMYLMFVKLFDKAQKTDWNQWAALFATVWFGLHIVNAETLNYIISRSDLLSTFFVVAAFVVYLYFPSKRKYGFYLLPFILGLFTKLTSAMFIPLLLVYYALFEYPVLRDQLETKEEKKDLIKSLIVKALFLILIMIIGSVFIMKMQGESFNPGGTSRWLYLITQPFVLFHYFISFFYAYNLSADTDMSLVEGLLDWRVYVGLVFVIGILWIAIKKGFNYKYAPFTFGIIWFFISLGPTSSLIPLAEVENDHRMFFPFVGLMISVVWLIFIFIWKYRDRIIDSKKYQIIIYSIMALILIGHIIGVRQRVEVWDNGESLWYDVTQKSPKNGRGWMNYGLRLMSKGDYDGAMKAYKIAKIHAPRYSYLYTNIAICENALGRPKEAEKNYHKAIQYGYYSHKPYYFYASFLVKKKRYTEAIVQIKKSQNLAPEYIYSFYLLMEIYTAQYDWDRLTKVVDKTLSIFPKDGNSLYYQKVAQKKMTKLDIVRENAKNNPSVNNYVDLSLEYYYEAYFDSCIYASKKVLDIDPNNVSAYNNICAANNQMQNWDASIAAAKEGLLINPDNQLLKNNLAIAVEAKAKRKNWKNKSYDELINLSLELYNKGDYQGCIDACNVALVNNPNDAIAYNNICSAYNIMKRWDLAIVYGNLAVKYDPNYQLAKNNLAYAEKMLAAQK